MVKALMASTGLSSLRPTNKKKFNAEDEPLPTNAKPAKAEDDDDDDKDKDKDDDKGKAKKAKKADSDDDDEDDENCSAQSRVRRVSSQHSADDDDDGDRADMANPVTRAARERERGKLRAILESKAGAAAFDADPGTVMEFLSTYSGSRRDAIATLKLFGAKTKPEPTRAEDPLRKRMAESDVPVVGPDATGTNGAGAKGDMVNFIVNANKLRHGEKV